MTNHVAPSDKTSHPSVFSLLERVGRVNRTLTLFVIVSSVMILVGATGIFVDSRVVLGQPVWAKTTKFALSFAFYGATLLWMLALLGRGGRRNPRAELSRSRHRGASCCLRWGLLVTQAVRGRPMHFNVATPLDGALWITMGLTVGVLYLITLVGLVVLAFQKFPERELAHGFKLGLFIAVMGMGLAYPMTQANASQRAALRAGEHLDLIGAHTVGGFGSGPRPAVSGLEHAARRLTHPALYRFARGAAHPAARPARVEASPLALTRPPRRRLDGGPILSWYHRACDLSGAAWTSPSSPRTRGSSSSWARSRARQPSFLLSVWALSRRGRASRVIGLTEGG